MLVFYATVSLLCLLFADSTAVRCGGSTCGAGVRCVACDGAVRYSCSKCPPSSPSHAVPGGVCHKGCTACVFCQNPTTSTQLLNCAEAGKTDCPKDFNIGDSYDFS